MNLDLQDTVSNWDPTPLQTEGVLSEWQVGAFAGVLGQALTLGEGDPLPPLWHWMQLLDRPRQSELGEDGHPAEGRFMPAIPERRRMIAGGRLRIQSPMLIGERVARESRLLSATVKSGRSGEMVFVTVQHQIRRPASGQILATEEQDVVYRSQPHGQTRTLPTGAGDVPEPSSRWRFETPTDPTLLFRFSALTYNTHRIHYDEPYVTDVEGYPGLVVQGPLLALLMLEIPRRYHPDAVVEEFDFRLSRPAFSGATVVTRGAPDPDDARRIVVAASPAGGPESISGSVLLRA